MATYSSGKNSMSTIDATPSKRIYQSIIADYRLNTAICELIDNAFDAWNATGRDHPLEVRVQVDPDQQTLQLRDNAGGVDERDLRKLISPGESSTSGEDGSIGVFGVGSKRAVVALAQHVQITTRYHTRGTFRVVYDDEWLSSESWELPYSVVGSESQLPPSTTEILLSRLRFRVSEGDIARLESHLSATYGKLIEGAARAIARSKSG